MYDFCPPQQNRDCTMTPTPSPENPTMNQWKNWITAAIAIVLSVIIGFSVQNQNDSSTLSAQAQAATPLSEALTNQKPTLLEFYADWCTSCQAMAKDLKGFKDQYGDRLNFTMLNVDNNKWLPEIMTYRVDGIPHFIFLNAQGEAIAETIGEQPENILNANLQALMAGEEIPYRYENGQVSQLRNNGLNGTKADDPRSHSAQSRV